MERNEFLSKLGIGLVTVCTGCSLVACGSKSSDPGPKPPADPPPSGGGDLFTINLDSELTSVGQTKASGGVILARIADGNDVGSFTAVQLACTHEGFPVGYNAVQGKFICPNHGSQFSTNGSVIVGPATTPLRKFNIAIAGNTLTVSA